MRTDKASQPWRLKEFAEERAPFIRKADNLICCLPIEREIELGLRPVVVPVSKRLQFAAPQAPFCQRGPSDVDADARRLAGDTRFPWGRSGGSDNATRDETLPTFVLARKDEDRVAFGDVLAAIHRFLRFKRECRRLRIANFSFDRERHLGPLNSFIRAGLARHRLSPL